MIYRHHYHLYQKLPHVAHPNCVKSASYDAYTPYIPIPLFFYSARKTKETKKNNTKQHQCTPNKNPIITKKIKTKKFNKNTIVAKTYNPPATCKIAPTKP